MSYQQKAKIRWYCRRGMLELDLLLNRFMETQFDGLSQVQVNAFEALLQCQDPELYAWLLGLEPPSNKEFMDIVDYIRNSHFTETF